MKYSLCCSVTGVLFNHRTPAAPHWEPLFKATNLESSTALHRCVCLQGREDEPPLALTAPARIQLTTNSVLMFTKKNMRSFVSCLHHRTAPTLTLRCPRLREESLECRRLTLDYDNSHSQSIGFVYPVDGGANHFFTCGSRICPLAHSCVDFQQYFCTFNKWLSILF